MRPYISIRLGTAHITRSEYMRAKALGYSREDIRQIIVENGQASFENTLDSQTFCPHGRAATEGPCAQCDIEAEAKR